MELTNGRWGFLAHSQSHVSEMTILGMLAFFEVIKSQELKKKKQKTTDLIMVMFMWENKKMYGK